MGWLGGCGWLPSGPWHDRQPAGTGEPTWSRSRGMGGAGR